MSQLQDRTARCHLSGKMGILKFHSQKPLTFITNIMRAAEQQLKQTGQQASARRDQALETVNSLCPAQLPQRPVQLMAKAVRLDLSPTRCIS